MAGKKTRQRRRGGTTSGRHQGGRVGRAAAGGRRAADPLLVAAAAVAGAIVLVAAAGFDDGLFAPFFVARYAPFYPLVVAFVGLALWKLRPGLAALRLDVIDALAAAAMAWLALGALLSPAPWIAWLGYYNRGSGAVFWIALLALFVAARRLLAAGSSQTIMVCSIAAALVLAAGVAVLQSRGVSTWWHVGHAWTGRMTGTTGNPINLAGLCLLAAWLGVLAATRGPAPLWLRIVAGVGVVAGLAGTLLAVTRASYLGLFAALVVVGVAWGRQRRLRLLAGVGVVVLLLVVGALIQVSSGKSARSLVQRFQATNVVRSLSHSDSKRVQLWRESLDAVADRSLVGYGAGAFVVSDRLHRPERRLITTPWNVATDPHSAPLLILAGTGVVGVLLFAALAVLCVVALVRRRRLADVAEAGVSHAAPASPVDAFGDDLRLATLAYVVACGVFLLVSPVDLVVVAPLALLVGAAVGPSVPDSRWARTLPAAPRAGKAVWIASLALASAAFVVVSFVGVRFWQADGAMFEFAATKAREPVTRAHDLAPWEPLYALEAGGITWREGLAAKDDALVAAGRALVEDGVALDRTGPMGYADLERLAIARGDLEEVAAQARSGLRWSPGHPILEGLWAYSAFDAVTTLHDPARGRRLLDAVELAPPRSPDAWHWIGTTDKALGDKAAATIALARAHALAPHLNDHQYQRRLLRSR